VTRHHGSPPTCPSGGCSRPRARYRRASWSTGALINDVVVEQVASLLGVDPHELDAGYDPDDDDD
jgi:hypothetical protein